MDTHDWTDCWDGINADSANHRDHVHNDLGDGITCPPSHPKRIAQITLEIDFWANDYKWQDIALSSGSKSGWGKLSQSFNTTNH